MTDNRTPEPKLRRRGRKRWWLAGIAGLGVLAVLWAMAPERDDPSQLVSISPMALPRAGTVSDRFLSYNVEMVEVTGGRFWKPYGPTELKGDDRYEYRPPMDLTHPRLLKLAAALGPAYVRFSGTWANATYFDPAATNETKPPKGYDTVLTGEQWANAVAFARAADAQIVTSFAVSPGARGPNGEWRSDNPDKFVKFTQGLGATIAAAEFANEPNFVTLTQAPEDYTPADYRRDYGRFHKWLRSVSPQTTILAPGASELAEPIRTMSRWLSDNIIYEREDLLTKDDPRPDAISFHFYGSGSERCGKIPVIGHTLDKALNDSWVSSIDKGIANTVKLRDEVAPGAPLWLTETGETACGGNPWAKTFADTFRFTDQLARAARQGVQVFMHNTLAASDYGIIDEKTHAPRPNYWAALLWRNLMGSTVLKADEGTKKLHVYAHCLRGIPGGVTVLAINLSNDQRKLQMDGTGLRYSLRQGAAGPASAALNGTELALGADDALPELRGAGFAAGAQTLEPQSITYLTVPGANNPACS